MGVSGVFDAQKRCQKKYRAFENGILRRNYIGDTINNGGYWRGINKGPHVVSDYDVKNGLTPYLKSSDKNGKERKW